MGHYKNPHYHRDYFRRLGETRRAYLRRRHHADPSRNHEASARYRASPAYRRPELVAKRRAYAKTYRATHPHAMTQEQREHQNLAQKLRRHGVTFEWWEAQPQTCAVCFALEPGGHGRWHIDHDHASGRVRGLLCFKCNVGLGSFQDDPAKLESAINYLKRTAGLSSP